MSDLISRQKVMWILTNLSYTQCKTQGEADVIETAKTLVITMPPAQSDVPDTNVGDMISRQAAIDAVKHAWAKGLEPTQYIEESPSTQPEWNNHMVACLLAELFGDDCACNYNGIDEWLPNKCELLDACPNPSGVACWEQYLKHRAERRTDEQRRVEKNT